jgi:DNA-binding transcriptional LysR family regulator
MLKNDLNLLTVFDTLYDLRSVTQAARRLNLTQSAVSHALRRVRVMVGDPLFVRAAGTLQPTARARAMAPMVREGLARLREAMLPAEFVPEQSQRIFTVAASSYFCALLIPRLIAVARAQAPGITVRTVPINADLLARLDGGTVDLALGAFTGLPRGFLVEALFREKLVWIASNDNPIVKQRLGHAELLRIAHLALDPIRTFEPLRPSFAGSGLDASLPAEQTVPPELQGSEATPAIVYDALTAIAVVAGTDLIALVPRRLALAEQKRHSVTILKTGDTGSGVDLGMVSRIGASSDAGADWLRAEVLELAMNTAL